MSKIKVIRPQKGPQEKLLHLDILFAESFFKTGVFIIAGRWKKSRAECRRT